MKYPFAALMILGALAACTPPSLNNLNNIGKESDPTRFYALTTQADAGGKAAIPSLTIGVGPVSVADYLDRSHIVVRTTANELQLADFDRWAGTPAKEIQRVLGANLAALLGTQRIVGYPWKSSVEPSMTVEVAVERFEYGADGKAWLVASWQVFTDNGRDAIAFRRSTFSKESSDGYDDIAAALSDLTGELSAHIADAVRVGYTSARR